MNREILLAALYILAMLWITYVDVEDEEEFLNEYTRER